VTDPPNDRREISRGIVAIYKDYVGRGPTVARTTINEDHVTTLCTESLTKAELKLVSEGDAETVREIRRKFQGAMQSDIVALVERVMDRKVKSFLSDHDVHTDVAIETVVFVDPSRPVEEPIPAG
jgi:uncharacterized protein YbcI